MLKFTCGHCGGRIAIPPKMVGKLVVCPDCGKPTHPLAGDILAAAKDGGPAAKSASAAPADRTCENCGRSIGRLEKPEVWNNHVVCGTCHARLDPPKPAAKGRSRKAAAAGPADEPAAGNGTPAAVAKALPVPADKAVVDVPAADAGPPAAGDAKTMVLSRLLPGRKPVKVDVTRAADQPAAAVAPAPLRVVALPMKYRLAAVAVAVFVGGTFLYGFLALIRDFMSVLTTVAVVLVAAAIGLVVVRVGVAGLQKWWAARSAKRAAAGGAASTATLDGPAEGA